MVPYDLVECSLRHQAQLSTQGKNSILAPQKTTKAVILLQTSLNDKHYCVQ